VPANQAGAGVFNCPDDYIAVSGVRLCGEKLNDATTNIDFTVNAPVTGIKSGVINTLVVKGLIFLYMLQILALGPSFCPLGRTLAWWEEDFT
jgi:hypothetical protein